mmetsp:Transcript_82176/g.172035  ORF Transcript_82176/g.172035 Transcript_82176/m.172035 type:complete len:274 (-) Transcript_82176:157-978(-)|eukprot:CAMPEP_0206451386 /NCGR_PEP_ID=MMETSP0324_2-20121206/19307_1 /ASSEMBLY_ACC=CAM_ASM_000836 /TAXON_ID=2866 /ORGANISM="Crypthecodinium cohnii, Strain Seligo" /LENGTH=273 /DNA_ID=CAMNT_0053921251 /DNA_START=101 /DNA_END=922 /DNA_ORIENTATION=-
MPPVVSESSDYSSNRTSDDGCEKDIERGCCGPMGKYCPRRYEAEATFVPYRMEQVFISWIFIVASVTLWLNFLSLQDLVRQTPPVFSHFSELCNWFGVFSCLMWFTGFAMLAHWLHQVGAGPLGKLGCYFKLLAAIFFNMQPATGTMNDPMLGGPAGLWWTNATGIILFHCGNCISCFDFWYNGTPGGDKNKGWFFHGNLPITGMWCYQMATWFLVASNVLACTPPGSSSILFVGHPFVYFCQMMGGFFLTAGSVVYAWWCDGLVNFDYEKTQ